MVGRNKIQKDILDSLPNPCHGLVKLAPRVGKSKIAISVIKRDKPKSILWVTPSTKLKDINIPEEFITWKAKKYLKVTTIICYASLAEHEGNYDMVILDEYQYVTTANMKPFFTSSITYNYIMALSGTHPTHKEKATIYEGLKLKTLVDVSIDEAVDLELIAPYQVTVMEVLLDGINKNFKAGSKDKPFLVTEKAQYKFLTRRIDSRTELGQQVPKFYYLNRMRFIYDLKSKNKFAKEFVAELPGRTLVFTGGIKSAEEMCEHSYHSKTNDNNLVAFQKEEIDTLACVNAGGVGDTYLNVDNFVIVQVNSNQRGDATQKIARSLVLQEDYKANIYIICVKDTVDELWRDKALANFKEENIKYLTQI